MATRWKCMHAKCVQCKCMRDLQDIFRKMHYTWSSRVIWWHPSLPVEEKVQFNNTISPRILRAATVWDAIFFFFSEIQQKSKWCTCLQCNQIKSCCLCEDVHQYSAYFYHVMSICIVCVLQLFTYYTSLWLLLLTQLLTTILEVYAMMRNYKNNHGLVL